MSQWVTQHMEYVLTAVVSFFLGVISAARAFIGIKNDVDDIKRVQKNHAKEIEAIKIEAAIAKGQRDQIISNTNELLSIALDKQNK